MANDALHGISAHEIASRTGASLVTARRWKRARTLPATVARLVRVVIHGDLGAIDPAWKHWKLQAGRLHGPDGFSFEPREVLALPFLHAQIRSLQQRERGLKAERHWRVQADWVSEEWVEPQERERA